MPLPSFPRPAPNPLTTQPPVPPVDSTLVNSVPTLAALRAFSGQLAGMITIAAGSASAGDGGGGTYFWNATDTSADNGTTVIAPSAGGIGRWNLLASVNTFNPATDPFLRMIS